MCPCCGSTLSPLWSVRGYDYFRCTGCGSLTIDPETVAAIDRAALSLGRYDEAYFAYEAPAARDRAYGASLARVAECALYSRVPLRRFLDVGTGHGYLLDALAVQLPSRREMVFGVELNAPPGHSPHPNYVEGSIRDLDGTFDAGVCIEVIEHLTPAQLEAMLRELAQRSTPGAAYLVNSAQPRYVLEEDREYLDPDVRGHIISYSPGAVRAIAERAGFRTLPIRNRTWCLLLEFDRDDPTPVEDRVWSAPEENRAFLRDPERGSIMYQLGIATGRAQF